MQRPRRYRIAESTPTSRLPTSTNLRLRRSMHPQCTLRSALAVLVMIVSHRRHRRDARARHHNG